MILIRYQRLIYNVLSLNIKLLFVTKSLILIRRIYRNINLLTSFKMIETEIPKKSKIVVVGSCSVDFTTYAPRLPKAGETLIGSKFNTSYGGKGANQCVASAKLGGNSYMICRVGDDLWGGQCRNNFIDHGVDVSHVYSTPGSATGIAQITVALNGENQIVIVPGSNGKLSLDDVKNSSDLITSADVLIGQLETPYEVTLEAFKLNKKITLLNAAPARDDLKEILPYCKILCVNQPEASLIINEPVNNLKDASVALTKILTMGSESVIITLGELGAVYTSKNDKRILHVPCKNAIPVDTTGAGDAFVGALATFLVSMKGSPTHQIIGAACDVATYSVTKEGTQTSYPTNFKPSKEYQYTYL